jgi:hypothetical protein
MYEIFLGSSNVWIEGARAARIGVDITLHCVFSTPKPSDLPIGLSIGTTVSASPNVLIGGVPMPSLTSLAIGAAFKAVFAGLGKAARAIRQTRASADDAAKASADDAAKASADDAAKASADDAAKASFSRRSHLEGKSFFLPKKPGMREPGAVDMVVGGLMRSDLFDEIAEGSRIEATGKALDHKGWPQLSPEKLATFKNVPEPIELAPGTKIYRFIDSESNPRGAFWTLDPPPRLESTWRSDSAVLNDWNGDGAYVEHVVGPEGLKGWSGPARAQLSSDGVSALPGGGEQFYVPPNTVPTTSAPKPTPWNR